MTEEQLKTALAEIEHAYKVEKNRVIIKFCNANNPYKVGDVFTDYIGSIKIEKIGYSTSLGKNCCTYTGVVLKKDGTINAKGEVRTAWQSNDSNTK